MFTLVQYKQEETFTHEFEKYCRLCNTYLSDYKFSEKNRDACSPCTNERKRIKIKNNNTRISQLFKIL